ncbi:MAG: hypothetical protein ACTHKG_03935 [Nocardioides sp.]
MLETIGFDAAVAASFAPWRAADASVGRVVRVDRGVVTVLTDAGAERVTLGGALLSEIAEHPDRTPCAGDWVVVRSWPDGPHTLERVLPRRTVVPGTAATGTGPALAANVDVLALLSGPGTGAAVPGLPEGVELLRLGHDPGNPAGPVRPEDVEAVSARLTARRTVALLGHPHRVAGLLDRLVGATALGGRQPGSELVVVPGGGAIVDLAVVGGPVSGQHPGAARPVS